MLTTLNYRSKSTSPSLPSVKMIHPFPLSKCSKEASEEGWTLFFFHLPQILFDLNHCLPTSLMWHHLETKTHSSLKSGSGMKQPWLLVHCVIFSHCTDEMKLNLVSLLSRTTNHRQLKAAWKSLTSGRALIHGISPDNHDRQQGSQKQPSLMLCYLQKIRRGGVSAGPKPSLAYVSGENPFIFRQTLHE